MNDTDTPDEFLIQLGKFVLDFAEIERFMHIFLHGMAGVRESIGPALLSGIRLDQAQSLINRILDTEEDTFNKSYLKRHFDQLGVINQVRNNILHYGADFQDRNTVVVSNRIVAHIPSRVREYEVTTHDLKSMSKDLQIIKTAIFVTLGRETLPPEMLDHYLSIAQTSWLYKQAQPKAHGDKNQGTPPNRKRR